MLGSTTCPELEFALCPFENQNAIDMSCYLQGTTFTCLFTWYHVEGSRNTVVGTLSLQTRVCTLTAGHILGQQAGHHSLWVRKYFVHIWNFKFSSTQINFTFMDVWMLVYFIYIGITYCLYGLQEPLQLWLQLMLWRSVWHISLVSDFIYASVA